MLSFYLAFILVALVLTSTCTTPSPPETLSPTQQLPMVPPGVETVDKTIVYKNYTDIPTYDVAALAVKLAKGERFQARIDIWVAQKREMASPPVQGTLIFYIYNPYNRRIIDAGLIKGQYEFAFTATTSGDYTMVFNDRDGHRIIRIHHNSPAQFRDVSIR